MICALTLLRGYIRRLHQTKLVHEECVRSDIDGLRVIDDLLDDPSGLVLLREANHLLKALLDEACEVDYASISGTLDLIILKQDVCSVQVDGLVNYVVRRRIGIIVGILSRNGVDGDATGLLSLLAVEF